MALDLQKYYTKFNKELFGNKLPKIPVEFGPLKTAVGDTTITLPEGKPKKIVMTNLYDVPKNYILGSLLHEMIHVWETFQFDPNHPLYEDWFHGQYYSFDEYVELHESTGGHGDEFLDAIDYYRALAISKYKDILGDNPEVIPYNESPRRWPRKKKSSVINPYHFVVVDGLGGFKYVTGFTEKEFKNAKVKKFLKKELDYFKENKLIVDETKDIDIIRSFDGEAQLIYDELRQNTKGKMDFYVTDNFQSTGIPDILKNSKLTRTI